MEYTRLGRTGLKVSRLCLGCMTFGREIDEAASLPIIQRALDEGVNFFDTANVYGNGASEEIVGRALKGVRQSIVLASKVYGQVGSGVNDRGLSRYHIMRAVEDSLRRLQIDHIDLYQVHRWDAETPIEETMRALDDIVRQGKARYIGVSNFRLAQIEECMRLRRIDVVQYAWNMFDRRMQAEIFPYCAREQIGIMAYGSLAYGMLSGTFHNGMQFDEHAVR